MNFPESDCRHTEDQNTENINRKRARVLPVQASRSGSLFVCGWFTCMISHTGAAEIRQIRSSSFYSSGLLLREISYSAASISLISSAIVTGSDVSEAESAGLPFFRRFGLALSQAIMTAMNRAGMNVIQEKRKHIQIM